MSYTYEEALKIVDEDTYPIKDGTQFVRKVVPSTPKYLEEFNTDLLVNKYKLYNKNSKDYAKDGKFKSECYKLSIMNEIFR